MEKFESQSKNIAKTGSGDFPAVELGWDQVLEQLIVGVSHNISNRISTLAGVSDILAHDPSVPPILRALTSEVPKLEESIRLLRLLAAPNEPEEAVEPLRVVNDAIALAELHPELRGVQLRVETDDAPPVMARPVALAHEIVTMLVAVGVGGSGELTVHVGVDGDDLVIAAQGKEVRAQTLSAARSRDR